MSEPEKPIAAEMGFFNEWNVGNGELFHCH